MKRIYSVPLTIFLALLLIATPVVAQRVNFSSLTAQRVSIGRSDAVLDGTLFDLNDTYIDQTINTENIGIPTVATASIGVTDGALFTIADGEIWIVHDILVRVTANYNCTGDNCTMVIGDGNDADGFITLTDAQLQAADTEGTGFQAGWQGMAEATRGVYLDEATNASSHPFVYAPSGGAETIDLDVGGTSPTGGTGTVYLIYTRIQ